MALDCNLTRFWIIFLYLSLFSPFWRKYIHLFGKNNNNSKKKFMFCHLSPKYQIKLLQTRNFFRGNLNSSVQILVLERWLSAWRSESKYSLHRKICHRAFVQKFSGLSGRFPQIAQKYSYDKFSRQIGHSILATKNSITSW